MRTRIRWGDASAEEQAAWEAGEDLAEQNDEMHLDELEIMADKNHKQYFDRRQPAFGWGEAELQSILQCAQQSDYQEYLVFDRLRSLMCRRLICASGASTVEELVEILRAEMESGVPGPVPAWYKMGYKSGPDTGSRRRFGYQPCTARGCPKTEDLETQFQQCTACKLAMYCSRECQVQDWKERHKKVCKKAKEMHQMTRDAASFMHMFQKQYG
jgi:MYND finger